jgi:peroxiredoxin
MNENSPYGAFQKHRSTRAACLALVVVTSVGFAGRSSADGDVKSTAPATSATETPATPPAPPLPGHSLHGEAFDEGPRQKAYLMGGTGGVHFPITAKTPLAQQFFDQGVGQLHGFWYFEAERSFSQVLLLDGDCAMAYWGLAMANVNNEKRAKSFIEKAVQKKAAANPREVAWIDALAAAYKGDDTLERRRKFVRDLESLVQSGPNDAEAKAFLVFQIWKNGSWMTESKKQLPIGSHQAVDSLLDQVFQINPMHPAHHYRIHLWDEEKPARALVSASLCGQTSPSIAHMWHMPGHTYSKLHRYADAAWQQEASARVDHAHMMRDGVLPDQIHNYAHNNEWLIRDWMHVGRVRDAIDLAINMIELPRHPKYNAPDKKGTSAAYGKARLVEVLEQFECWPQVISHYANGYLGEPTKPEQKLERARLLGLAGFGLGNAADGQKQLAQIQALLAEARADRYKAADAAETKARGEKKSDKDVSKAMADALGENSKSVKNVEFVLAELEGHAALAAGKTDQAKAEFEKLKDAPLLHNDRRSRLFSLAGDHAQAETLARKAFDSRPNEAAPLAILVDVLYRAGKKTEVQTEFAKLRATAAAADLESPLFARLAPIAAELGWPADWRQAGSPPADVGQRPELAQLGPLRWEPTPATGFTLPGADGKPISLGDYHGRGVVVIFYLGSGCLHCVEQLHKFAPLASQYAAAGISLVAVSSEPLDSLSGSLAALSAKEAIPFPLAADPQLGVFKAYRAFDDFEKMPLHATFLIDAKGKVRWHDISAEPFSDAPFLLEEAKRLLAH